MDKSYLLYDKGSNVPILCEREDWTKCPEHKHLSLTPPPIDLFEGDSSDIGVDDPNDDIISPNEYATLSNDEILKKQNKINALTPEESKGLYEFKEKSIRQAEVVERAGILGFAISVSTLALAGTSLAAVVAPFALPVAVGSVALIAGAVVVNRMRIRNYAKKNGLSERLKNSGETIRRKNPRNSIVVKETDKHVLRLEKDGTLYKVEKDGRGESNKKKKVGTIGRFLNRNDIRYQTWVSWQSVK